MERLGLGYEALAADNPRLIYCSITGFGSEGPYRSRPGYDTVGQAMSGLLAVLTDRKAPQPMGISLSDHLAGTFAAYGVLAALMARNTSGRGQKVETSLLQATLAFLGENAANFFEDGRVPIAGHAMPARPGLCLHGRRRSAVRRAFVVAGKILAGPSGATDRQALATDERFRNRERAGEELRRAARRARRRRSSEAARGMAQALEARGCAVGPINTIDEVFADPQVVALDMRKRLPHRTRGTVSVVGNPVRMSATPPRVDTRRAGVGRATTKHCCGA